MIEKYFISMKKNFTNFFYNFSETSYKRCLKRWAGSVEQVAAVCVVLVPVWSCIMFIFFILADVIWTVDLSIWFETTLSLLICYFVLITWLLIVHIPKMYCVYLLFCVYWYFKKIYVYRQKQLSVFIIILIINDVFLQFCAV